MSIAKLLHRLTLVCVIVFAGIAIHGCGDPMDDASNSGMTPSRRMGPDGGGAPGTVPGSGPAAGASVVASGDWGSPSALLKVDGSGSLYYHGCIYARISGPIPVGTDGSFSVTGQIYPGSRGALAVAAADSRDDGDPWSDWWRWWRNPLPRRHAPSHPRPNPDDPDEPDFPDESDPVSTSPAHAAPRPSPTPTPDVAFPASFTGKVSGSSLTITASYSDGRGSPQHFSDDLRLGAPSADLSGCR